MRILNIVSNYRVIAFELAGLDLLLLQFSPQLEEMERFSRQVMPLVEAKRQQFAS
jgi:FMNH2-dependent dimethyl sulfone monooxygenase